MKEKKNDKNGRIITKDRVISVVIGVFIGVIITSGLFCICIGHHFPKNQDKQVLQMQYRNMPNVPRKNDRPQYKAPSNDSNKNNETTDETKDETKDSNTQNNN